MNKQIINIGIVSKGRLFFESKKILKKNKLKIYSGKRELLGRVKGRPDLRILLPASIFFGASFLIICDTLARTIIAPTEIPVGIITAMLGGPFFVWLLKRPKS